MIMEKLMVNSDNSNMKGLYQVGGMSAIVLTVPSPGNGCEFWVTIK